MKNVDHLSRPLTKKLNAFEAARLSFHREVKKALPLGTVIETLLGRAWVRGPVTGYGCEWVDPQRIQFTNQATGKVRQTYVWDENLTVVFPGKREVAA